MNECFWIIMTATQCLIMQGDNKHIPKSTQDNIILHALSITDAVEACTEQKYKLDQIKLDKVKP